MCNEKCFQYCVRDTRSLHFHASLITTSYYRASIINYETARFEIHCSILFCKSFCFILPEKSQCDLLASKKRNRANLQVSG